MEENIDILQFYAYSKDTNAGKGIGDYVKNPRDYKELNKIKNWRRMFSSFWSEDPFIYNNKTYLSFEHAFQSSKYRINGYEDLANEFNLESKSEISLLIGKDVKKAGRKIKLTEQEISKWNQETRFVKESIYKAKYTRDTNPGKALIETKNATLINAGPRIKRIHCTRLEELRKNISKGENLYMVSDV